VLEQGNERLLADAEGGAQGVGGDGARGVADQREGALAKRVGGRRRC
jgi:hypothetical protein